MYIKAQSAVAASTKPSTRVLYPQSPSPLESLSLFVSPPLLQSPTGPGKKKNPSKSISLPTKVHHTKTNMLQYHSRLAAIAARSFRAFSLAPKRAFATGTLSGRTADPEVHSIQRGREVQPAVLSGKLEETQKHYEPKQDDRQQAEVEAGSKHYFRASMEKLDPLSPPRPPHASSPRLESVRVHNPAEAIVQQKREFSSTVTSTLDDVSCAGLDGSPWPNDQEQNTKSRERVEDDKEYFKHHKASPLSEIEFVDTRKPITRATDGTANTVSPYGQGRDVIGWLPEQLDTAEEALERARRIWMQNATRGDPYSPHGRVLRELRGEWF